MKVLNSTKIPTFISLDNKKWIDPMVIELDDNMEHEDEDFDCIPPSPTPDELSSAFKRLAMMYFFPLLKYSQMFVFSGMKTSRVKFFFC